MASLIDGSKKDVEVQVKKMLQGERWFNFTTDGSESRNGDRVINFALNTAQGHCFFIENVATADNTQTAKYVLEHFIRMAKEVTDGKLEKVNSIATDTCLAMRAFHREVVNHPDLKHVFVSLCESHGIQLFLKDVLGNSGGSGSNESINAISKTPVKYYQDTLAEAQFISTMMRASSKAYAHVKAAIKDSGIALGLRKFAISVITRWGSQFAVIDAILANRMALECTDYIFCGNKGKDVKKAYELIGAKSWWTKLKHLHAFLQVVHEAQIISESDRSTVGRVIPRWYSIINALKRVRPTLPDLPEIERLLRRRLDLQITTINWVAYALDPATPAISRTFTPERIPEVYNWLWTHSNGRHAVLRQFADFCGQEGQFHQSNEALWSLNCDPYHFWRLLEMQAPELSLLATRLWVCPANSVPSERSFSATNYIQSRFRSRLSTERTSLLTYIYMNLAALRNSHKVAHQHQASIDMRRKRWEEEALQRIDEIELAIDSAPMADIEDDYLVDLADEITAMGDRFIEPSLQNQPTGQELTVYDDDTSMQQDLDDELAPATQLTQLTALTSTPPEPTQAAQLLQDTFQYQFAGHPSSSIASLPPLPPPSQECVNSQMSTIGLSQMYDIGGASSPPPCPNFTPTQSQSQSFPIAQQPTQSPPPGQQQFTPRNSNIRSFHDHPDSAVQSLKRSYQQSFNSGEYQDENKENNQEYSVDATLLLLGKSRHLAFTSAGDH